MKMLILRLHGSMDHFYKEKGNEKQTIWCWRTEESGENQKAKLVCKSCCVPCSWIAYCMQCMLILQYIKKREYIRNSLSSIDFFSSLESPWSFLILKVPNWKCIAHLHSNVWFIFRTCINNNNNNNNNNTYITWTNFACNWYIYY
jgi:hypothetical protein